MHMHSMFRVLFGVPHLFARELLMNSPHYSFRLGTYRFSGGGGGGGMRNGGENYLWPKVRNLIKGL